MLRGPRRSGRRLEDRFRVKEGLNTEAGLRHQPKFRTETTKQKKTDYFELEQKKRCWTGFRPDLVGSDRALITQPGLKWSDAQ